MDRLVVWHRAALANEVWVARVAEHLRAAGGQLLACPGASVCAVFAPRDAARAVDSAATLAREAQPSGARVAFGVAASEDRAQLLANRAKSGEVVLDEAAMGLVRDRHQFGREVRTGRASERGRALDAVHANRARCRAAARALGVPPTRKDVTEAGERITKLARIAKTHVVLVTGSDPDDIDALFEHLVDQGALRIPAVPLALEPLGSLRIGLVRFHQGESRAKDALESAPDLAPLAQIVAGVPAARAPVRDALRAWLDFHGGPVVVLDTVEGVDLATLDVTLSAATRAQVVVVTRRPTSPQGSVPTALARIGEVHHVALDPAAPGEVESAARMLFGDRAATDVIEHTIALGGGTVRGSQEAARTLLSSGDVVDRDGRFVFRGAPRGHGAPGIAALVLERAVASSKLAYRLLEVVCVLPDGTDDAIIARVAERCGVGPGEREQAVRELRDDALLRASSPLRASSVRLRAALDAALSPSRSLALHHFAASELAAPVPSGSLVQATIAFYLAHAAKGVEAARAALAAGGSALACGFKHAAVRLAAYAVQLDPSAETRAAAALLTSGPGKPEEDAKAKPDDGTRPGARSKRDDGRSSVFPSRGSVFPGSPDDEVLRRTVEALRDGDAEAVDRHIDLASALGRDPAAVNRLRAMAHLVRGDVAGAMQALATAKAHDSPDGRSSARASIALAIVLLRAGNTKDAVRAALSGLAHARSLSDARGEAAAMHALATCYRALGKADVAKRIDEASPDALSERPPA